MKLERLLAALVCCATFAAGCIGGSGDGDPRVFGRAGSISFAFDAAALGASATPTITAATVTLSRSGYADVTSPLTVSNGVASGQIDGLDPGYWHVAVEVFDGATPIYTGATDVNVIAGVTVRCEILFDPVVTPPTTGSVLVTVGLNPMPGYTVVNQIVTQALLDRAHARLFILDATTNLIGVYDAEQLVRLTDLTLPSSPSSIALNAAGTGLYVGFPSGRIHLLDVATGTLTLVADALMQVQGLVPLGGDFLMVAGPGGYSYTTLKVVNVATGQIVSTRSPYYSLAEMLYNPSAKTVYAHHLGVSPTDIHYVKVDQATGAISADGDSVYHGDYSFGRPLRVINGGARIATSSGVMFTSAELAANDLRYAGSLGTPYVDLAADDAAGKLYLVTSGALPKLLVIDDTTYFVALTVDLAGTPARVLETESSVIVIATKDGRTFAKALSKASLGL